MGGIPQGYVDMSVPRVDFECYVETPFQAQRVWLAVQEALQNLSRDVQVQCGYHLTTEAH